MATDVERREKAEADLAEVRVKAAKIELKMLKMELARQQKANGQVEVTAE